MPQTKSVEKKKILKSLVCYIERTIRNEKFQKCILFHCLRNRTHCICRFIRGFSFFFLNNQLDRKTIKKASGDNEISKI